MNTASRTVKLFIIYLIVHESATLEEGDFCELENGSHGVCTPITKCRSAMKAKEKGVLPTACSFTGFVIVTCCKKNVVSVRSPASLVADRMCKEYTKYAKRGVKWSITRVISGGITTEIQEFPHMALLGYQKDINKPISWNCGGTLISHNFVLTAGHCLYHINLGSAKFVRLGIRDQKDLRFMQQLEVQQGIAHPNYTGRKYHDIGLLKLVSNVRMNSYARAACLYTEKELPEATITATGWGLTEETGDPSDTLLKVQLWPFPVEDCDDHFRRVANDAYSELANGIVDDWMICAGSYVRRADTCRGDSGGPLQTIRQNTNESMYNIIGITSFGTACGLAQSQPGVYTRVSNYISWIQDVVWPNEK